jgi:dTMP kinase
MKGKLIVIEGCDGTGKETQVKMLKEALVSKGLKVATLDFPRYTQTVGGKLLALALGKNPSFQPDFEFSKLAPEVASLLYAMDRKESAKYVEQLLEENDVVILDRYYTANLLHQGAKFGEYIEKRNNFIDMINNIELKELKIPKPDSVIYLTIPFYIFQKRMESRKKNQGQTIDQVEQDEEYIKSAIDRGESIAKYCGWQVVAGVEGEIELSREEVHAKILEKSGF